MLYPLANTAKPIGFNDSAVNVIQPLFFEVPRIPQSSLYLYTSILVDKGNRLFITNEHDVFIYDGVNYQQINVPGKPTIAYDGDRQVLIAGYNYLSLITLNQTGEYTAKQLIDPSANNFKHQISSVGFDGNIIYLSTGTKLWRFNEKPVPVDSSNQPIIIYPNKRGLVFYSSEKGFFDVNSNNVKALNLIKNQININDKFLQISTAGSFYFVTTASNHLLMFDAQGSLIKVITGFGNNSDMPVDICSSDDINFFAITPTQIFRFINPMLAEIIKGDEKLVGSVKATRIFDSKLYVVTSYGLYSVSQMAKKNSFMLLKQGDFNGLFIYQNQLFATETNGLSRIYDQRVVCITPKSSEFQKSCVVDFKEPKAFFLNAQGVFYSTIIPPYAFHELITDKKHPIIDFYSIDSTLLLKNANEDWFIYNSKKDRIFVQTLLNSNDYNPQFIINNDTLILINNQLAKKSLLGFKSNIGKTYSNQPIRALLSGFHPNYQSFFIDSHMHLANTTQTADLAIENTSKVNEVYLDPDSTVWLSANNGLIRVSSEYLKQSKRAQANLMIFSASIIHKGVSSLIYNGFIRSADNSNTTFRIKQGHSIEINLSGLGPNNWNSLSYSYRLKDNNINWSNWSSDSKVVLDDLAPGKNSYAFKARDAIGVESGELNITITIIPNFIQTRFTIIAIIILALLVIYSIIRWRSFSFALERFKLESIINRRTEELVKEKEKTDNLLARVLPRETATELKETGKVNTQMFTMATVLFSDIQGFTKITDELNPENLIDQLDKFFLYFDSVVDKYKIEKIKTIGDAYMCAGGIPHKNRTNPVEVVLAALEMLYFMREINLEHNPGQDIWDLRIGIDTGPVIAGVVGRNKLSYDIWGTTVNTASRMESSGEVGKINISGNTHIFIQDYFLCTYRGKMPIKNKGDIEMYFVEGIKPMLSNNLDIFRPNNEFQVQLQLLRFGDLEEFILEKLEKGLPKNLYYHNLKHTVDVYTQVELIGRSEDVSLEEQLLLQTAALLHDAGHLIDYDTHEEMGVKLAREILPEYQYSERQIEIISELILVTKLPPRPKNLLEAIMCDADLDYLGRTDFIPVSNMLYKELHEHGRIGTIQEWNELQIKFIEKHQYFTNTARKLRNVNKNSQLENIKNWIEKNKL